jgi:hypothetical protein
MYSSSASYCPSLRFDEGVFIGSTEIAARNAKGEPMTDTERSGASETAGLAPVVGAFVAGAIGVLAFHQLTWWLLYIVGIVPDFSYRLKPTAPLGVPQVLSQAFSGGLWGIVLAVVLLRRGRANYWVFAMAFGLIAPTLVGWLVVPLIKGAPLMGGPPWIIQVVRPMPNLFLLRRCTRTQAAAS